jgi:hypothetical protein
MTTFGLLVLAGAALAAGMPVVFSRTAGRVPSRAGTEFAHWICIDAEVISTLRVRHRIFLRVRFAVGTSIIQTDVEFPLTEAVPNPGQRVPIRYDPTAPARVTFERSGPIRGTVS